MKPGWPARTSDELSDFLSQQQSAGELESQGFFTIAAEAAIGKLAAFGLPRASAWILKIVQAAVAAGAPRLQIAQHADVTLFEFEPGRPTSGNELQQWLASVQASPERWLQHLAAGLRSVGFADQRAFTLSLRSQGVETLIGWDGQELRRRDRPDPEFGRLLRLGVSFPADDRGKVLGGAFRSGTRAVEEYQELVNNASACPIPCLVDGRRIDTLERRQLQVIECSRSLLGLGWGSGVEGLHPFGPPQGLPKAQSSWRPSDRFTDSRPLTVVGQPGPTVSLLWRLEYHYRIEGHRSRESDFRFHSLPQSSRCCWLRDGVACQVERIEELDPSPISLTLYVGADDLETDISGFAMRDERALGRRLKRALRALVPQLAAVDVALQEHRSLPFGSHVALYGGIGLAVVTAVPTLGKSMVAALLGVQLLQSAHDKSQIVRDCRSALESFLINLDRVAHR